MPAAETGRITTIHAARVHLQHDGPVRISAGRSRKETRWKNTEIPWSEFLAKIQTTTRTRETFTQYKKMSKTEQSDVKDVGGYVGGTLQGGHRKTGHVLERSLLTLDADFAGQDFPEVIGMLVGNAYALYTTHSHSPQTPRWRMVVPLTRTITPDEYKPLARFLAADLGIDLWDDSTYEPERLMYWPSTAEDGEFIADYADGPWLNPDEVLQQHPFWHDATTWPESSRMGHNRQRFADRQGDPHEKPGVIGAFNRAYSIPDAIERFLPDTYVACEIPNRYTYTQGTTAAGLVVYDGEKFAYSNHGTDPAGGQLCNAFDLVRLHRFGALDEDQAPDTAINLLPSYKEMLHFALLDDTTRMELAASTMAGAREDFAVDNAWLKELEYTDKGGLIKSINNALLLIEHDPDLKDGIGYDDFTRKAVTMHPLPWKPEEGPWTDADDSALRHYLENKHRLKDREDITDALAIALERHTYHPVRDYLNGLNWDGEPRIDRLLIDLMGADDTAYVQAVTRKWLCAAVARVRNPGCKFDTMLILVGAQGIGKSQFFNRLTKNPAWFSDSMAQFDNTKEAMEQLAGKWILEIGELASMKRSEIEGIKTFLSKQSDDYRPSYARRLQNFPRQCIFAGTTNRDDFLQDMTGGRRFWPVVARDATLMWQALTGEYVDQVWAEADAAYALGEELYISGQAAKEALEIQENFTELGGKLGMAELYLQKLVPANWDEMKMTDRTSWLHGYDFDTPVNGTYQRETISGIELFVECFNGIPEQYKKADAYEMTDLLFTAGWSKTGKRATIVDYGRQRIHRKTAEQFRDK